MKDPRINCLPRFSRSDRFGVIRILQFGKSGEAEKRNSEKEREGRILRLAVFQSVKSFIKIALRMYVPTL